MMIQVTSRTWVNPAHIVSVTEETYTDKISIRLAHDAGYTEIESQWRYIDALLEGLRGASLGHIVPLPPEVSKR